MDKVEPGAKSIFAEGNPFQATEEDYLLGRKIGKNFETEGTMGQINAVEYDCAPPSIFASQAQHQVDLQRKLLEDPLVAIKKREMEDRKRLLDNPLKMKALQEHIEKLKKEKKDKKKKKKKKKKHKGSDSDDSDGDLDLKLLQHLQRIEGREAEADRKRFKEEEVKEKAKDAGNKYTDVEPGTPPREARHSHNNPRHNDFSERRNFSRVKDDVSTRRNRSPDDRRMRKPPAVASPPQRRQRSRSNRRRRSHSRDRHESLTPPRNNRRRSRSADHRRRRRSRSDDRSERRRRSQSNDSRRKQRHDSESPPKRQTAASPKRRRSPEKKPGRKQLDDDEKARKLAEMMDNATWREEQRAIKVNKYREQDTKEQDQITKDHDHSFLQRELKKATANSTVEARIKSNKHNIQKGVGVMDSNFAKR